MVSVLDVPSLLPAGLPHVPEPGQLWAVMVWLIIPAVLAIWSVYFRQQENLRRARRRMRQLEARLAAGVPSRPQPVFSIVTQVRPSPKPSSLTTRILLPESEKAAPTFASPGPVIP
jgi:hypothetical protein